MRRDWSGWMFLLFAVLLVVFLFVGTLIFKGLWNWVVPPLFHGPELTF